MMQAEQRTDFRLTISRREAEDIFTKVLDKEKFDKPRDRALEWLEDLLKHHLIQVTSNDQIEFCHQLIQEYYAAEHLLKLLTPPTPLGKGRARDSDSLVQKEARDSDYSSYSSPLSKGGLRGVSDDELKREYLNYLKWTEPLALMLELVEDEAQAVQLVRLALEVDLRLGARLAGAVKPKWQEQTMGLVAGLEIPQLVKIQLVNLTKSERAIPELVKALNDENSYVRNLAAYALGNIGSDAATEGLVKALNDEDYSVRSSAAIALGNIDSETAIKELVNALDDEDFGVYRSAAIALRKIASPELVPGLYERIKVNEETELLYTISAIQERCKFYNYTLTQPSSPRV